MSKWTFPILGDEGYAGYLAPLTHTGSNPTTHVAEVRYPVQHAPVASVVKLLHPSRPNLCNEGLAWLFLRGAGVAQPPKAAILVLSETKAVDAVAPKKLIKPYVTKKRVLAWASERLNHRSIAALFSGTKGDRKWAKLMCTVEGSAIAAFDEAFYNIDRNNGNLLFVDDHSCMAIDNETLFGLHDWTAGPIPATTLESHTLREIKACHSRKVISTLEMAKIYNQIAHHAEAHSNVLAAVQQDMTHLIKQLYGKKSDVMAGHVLSFLTARTAQNWMNQRVGVM